MYVYNNLCTVQKFLTNNKLAIFCVELVCSGGGGGYYFVPKTLVKNGNFQLLHLKTKSSGRAL